MAEQLIIPADILEGLSAAISVNVYEPSFDSQGKKRLSGPDEKKAIYTALVKEFNKMLKDMPAEEKQVIITKIRNNSKSRRAAEVAKITKKKSLSKNASPANLPTHLSDCDKTGSEFSELYICEGDSASGSIVSARDAEYQAVLPIRGKILNVFKTDFNSKTAVERFNKNSEINDLIKALGAGIREHFDIEKSRYNKIFIATDQDVDGMHISILLLGIIYKLFLPMIEEGRVYQACSPLYEFEYKKDGKDCSEYAMTDGERMKIEERLRKAKVKYSMSRAKGLGELDAKVFNELVMDPSKRKVIRITMENAKSAYDWLMLAIGDIDTQERKDWMIDNIQVVDELGLYA